MCLCIDQLINYMITINVYPYSKFRSFWLRTSKNNFSFKEETHLKVLLILKPLEMSLDDLVVGEATGLKFVFSAGPQIDSHEPSFLCFINSLIYNHLQSAIRRIQKSLANESVNIGDRNHTCPKNQDRIRLYSITQLCVVFCLFFCHRRKEVLQR